MENAIEFKYFSGSIKMELDTVLMLSPARVKALVKAAIENTSEVIERISARILTLVDALGFAKSDKELEAKYMDILVAINPGAKRSREEKAALRIIKSATKTGAPDFAGAFEDAGYQCITDGRRLVRFSARHNLPVAGKTLDTAGIIGDASRYSIALVLPELKTLKRDISLAKKGVESGNLHIISGAKSRRIIGYDFGHGLPVANAAYLVDMLEALPGAQAFCYGKSSPIYFGAENGNGILLPIRKTEERELNPTTVPATESAETTDATTDAQEQAAPEEQEQSQDTNNATTDAAEQERGPDATCPKLDATPAAPQEPAQGQEPPTSASAALPEVLPVLPAPPQASTTSAVSALFCGFLPAMVSQHTRAKQRVRNARKRAFCAVSFLPVLPFCCSANRPPGKYLQ